jgi:putative ABC transport system permease protein
VIEYALRELIRHRRRTIAHTAGFAVAIAIITLVINVLFNGEAASRSVLSGTGTHFVAFIPQCTNETCKNVLIDPQNEGFYVGSTRAKILSNTYVELTRSLSSVADAAPVILFRLANAGGALPDVMISGIPLDSSLAVANNSCSARDVKEGRFLTTGDTNAVVLEQSFAQSRYLSSGTRIALAGGEYLIVGIVNSGIRPAKADIYMGLEPARRIVNTRLMVPLNNEGSLILVESKSSLVHEEAIARVKGILGGNGSISSYNCYKPAAEVMGINGTSAFIITLIVFISVLAFALQSQYSRVVERRYDIGILSAIGWPKSAVLTQILYESLIQSLAGWVIGSILAVLALILIPSDFLVGGQTGVLKTIFPEVFVFSLLLCAIGGMVAGFFPGLFAVTRKPAECLRRL